MVDEEGSSSSSQIESIERDFESSYLTLKGYKRQKLQLELKEVEDDFRHGYLTEHGFQSKKSKLMERLQELEQPATTKAESKQSSVQRNFNSNTDCAGATKLCRDESVHSTLSKLFKKTKASVPTGSQRQPKISLKCGGGSTRSSKRETVAVLTEKDSRSKFKPSKPVTVVLLDSSNFTIPKDKKKLRAENRLNFCSFLPTDSVEDVNRKIRDTFPSELLIDQGLVFFQSTQSGDLFDAASGTKDFSPDGKTVLNLAGSGSLYVGTRAIPQTKHESANPVTVVVQPIVNKPQAPELRVVPATSEISRDMKLRKDLFDEQFFYLIRCESLTHMPESDEDFTLPPNVQLDRDKGEFLLSIN